jgi:hypothetical protein
MTEKNGLYSYRDALESAFYYGKQAAEDRTGETDWEAKFKSLLDAPLPEWERGHVGGGIYLPIKRGQEFWVAWSDEYGVTWRTRLPSLPSAYKCDATGETCDEDCHGSCRKIGRAR